jgi:hypothetical protein
MSNCLHRSIRVVFGGIVAMYLPGATAVYALAANCTSTALYTSPHRDGLPKGLVGEAYYAAGVRWDPVLQREWILLGPCEHPERLPVARQLPSSEQDDPVDRRNVQKIAVISRGIPLVVHAGEIVQLWKQEDNLRIVVAGVSEEGAGLGKTVRVRLVPASTGQQQERQLSGIVRGPGIVEMK